MNVSTLVKSVAQTNPVVEPIENSKKKRVGILGGTFNPPHTGHLIIADLVAILLDLDKMLLMPDSSLLSIDYYDAIAAYNRRPA